MNRSTILAIFLGMNCLGAYAGENPDIPSSIPETDISSPDFSGTLPGDRGGRRSAMAAYGYDWQVVYKFDLIGKVSTPNRKAYGLELKSCLD